MNILSEIRTRIFQVSSALLLAAVIILGALYSHEKSRTQTLEAKITTKTAEIFKLNDEKVELNARLADKDAAKIVLADENQKAIEATDAQCARLIKSAVAAVKIPPIQAQKNEKTSNNINDASCPELYSMRDIETAFGNTQGDNSGN